MNGNTETVGSLAGTGNVSLGTATLTAGGNNTTTTYSGVISGTGGLTKAGTGTMTLSGANTFSGATTVNAGTLDVGGTGTTLGSTSLIMLNTGGTLLLTGTGGNLINNAAEIKMNGGTFTANDRTETMGNLTLTANSTINLSVGGAAATLTFSNTTWVPGAFTLTINNWTGSPEISGTDDRIFFDAALGGSTLTGISFTGFPVGARVLSSGEVVPVPEPATILSGLLLMGLLAGRLTRDKS